MFRTVRTLIVDEIHTLVGSKRGVHLALSAERLEHLADERVQRVGLSATIRPLDEVARFLAGAAWETGGAGSDPVLVPRPVTVVDAGREKPLDLQVQTLVDDFRRPPGGSIWPTVVGHVADLIERHKTTLVFANSRRTAERTADWLNEELAARAEGRESPLLQDGVAAGVGMLAARDRSSGRPQPHPIRAHHGSMAKEARLEMEQDLKAGDLPALVGTSSLELGIDIGAVDLVVQLQSPKAVAQGLQRVGRSGHLVGQTSKGRIIPTFREDVMESAVIVGGMLRGEVEETHTPQNPLDVLAQQIVAACALEPLDADLWFEAVRRSAPFATLPRSAFEATLDLLSGKYPSTEFAELRPRLVYDRDAGTLTARPGAQRLGVTSGGAIPDRGLFTVYLASSAESEKPSRVGELDEEMVYESRPGDVISLGATSWRITEITHDRVLVIPAPGEPARLPFWRGDGVGRPAEGPGDRRVHRRTRRPRPRSLR